MIGKELPQWLPKLLRGPDAPKTNHFIWIKRTGKQAAQEWLIVDNFKKSKKTKQKKTKNKPQEEEHLQNL